MMLVYDIVFIEFLCTLVLLMSGYLEKSIVSHFQKTVLDYYHEHGRVFAWRKEPHNPYHILVSEIMLQQTQTHRVVDKFAHFISNFPDVYSLSKASLHDVLSAWQGLGYNRRGQALQKCAQKIVAEFEGFIPCNPQVLETFPGIGKATASSICAFAFDMPTVFIETNIRAVYIYMFFKERTDVKDNELIPLVEQTLYRASPRVWYYALMDYGVTLKKQFKNPSKRSAHYTKQSAFDGSERQIRGMIIKLLVQYGVLDFHSLCSFISREQSRIARNLERLCTEGLILENGNYYSLGK